MNIFLDGSYHDGSYEAYQEYCRDNCDYEVDYSKPTPGSCSDRMCGASDCSTCFGSDAWAHLIPCANCDGDNIDECTCEIYEPDDEID